MPSRSAPLFATRAVLRTLSQPVSSAPEDLNARYNNPALVPDFPGIVARWRAESAEARARLPARLDLRYGPGPKQTLDVFTPPGGAAGTPVLVFIHGGFWRAMDKADHSFVAAPFVARGASVVLPNYDLCPDVGVADITLQMAAALAWTWRHAADWGGDRARIALSGHSAGGQLAAMLLACDGRALGTGLPRQLARRALSISGVHELESIRLTPMLQGALQLGPEDAVRLSPAWLTPPAHVRLDAVVGGAESVEFLRQNRLIAAAWGAARVPVCEEIAGENHFSMVERLAEPGHRVNALAQAMLDA